MTYSETINYLFSNLPAFHRTGAAAYRANLDTTLKLDEIFNRPHTQFKSIHVAGTNGKGSVSHILASILQSAGYRVGLYTSPHLTDFRERIKINGNEIPEHEVVHFVEKYKSVFAELQPSFFEMTVALAFDYFARQKIDLAVVETGLGGRLDSTNIISPLISIITNTGFDHTEFLGKTITSIATEKAGIIKPQTPVVVGEWDDESAVVFSEKATSENAEIIFASQCAKINEIKQYDTYQEFEISAVDCNLMAFDNKKIKLDLLGNYQQKNIITALAAIATLQKNSLLKINTDSIFAGFASAAKQTGLRGRWQILSKNPFTVCDTGHNAHGLNLSMTQLKSLKRNRLFFVFGTVADKDLDSILPLLPQDAFYIFTSANIPRAMSATCLAQRCTAANLQGKTIPNVKDALLYAQKSAQNDDVIFIGGSTYVVAEIIDSFPPLTLQLKPLQSKY
ncbi:MAG: bifunctional folylpolyglutamate synthase/dihydrofolate synthase [Prevotellaceae bacterium]|jgi:dihydrofolate synthase/folylpolyglutamate synthase|nr:bifunctional folylpolyglutamate synthase/dihydrofolate synthase [Prevotellaceae bacterium]